MKIAAIAAIITTFLSIVFVLFVMGMLNQVYSHGWYDPICCSDRDCAPVTNVEATTIHGVAGEMMTSKIGTTFVPKTFDRVYPSRDSEVHICMTLPRESAPSIPLCVYRPMMF